MEKVLEKSLKELKVGESPEAFTTQLLFKEKPYAAAVSRRFFGKMCFTCFKETEVKWCTQCGTASYCGRKCQVKDWKSGQHKRECDIFKHIKKTGIRPNMDKGNLTDTDVRLAGRILARMAEAGDEGEMWRSQVTFSHDFQHLKDSNKPRKISDQLRGQSETIGRREVVGFRSVYGKFSSFYTQIPDAQVLRALKMSTTNAYPITQLWLYPPDREPDVVLTALNTKGHGFYLEPLRFNHSCDPDLRAVVVDGGSMCVSWGKGRPKAGVQAKIDLNKLTVSAGEYVVSALPTALRQILLPSVAMANLAPIPCQCSLCRDTKLDSIKTHSLAGKCPEGHDGLVAVFKHPATPSMEIRCSDCAWKLVRHASVTETKELRFLMSFINSKWSGNEAHAESSDSAVTFDEALKVLHPSRNWYRNAYREISVAEYWDKFKTVIGFDPHPQFLRMQIYPILPQCRCIWEAYQHYYQNSGERRHQTALYAMFSLEMGDMKRAKELYLECRGLWLEILCDPSQPIIAQIDAILLSIS